MQRRGHSGKRRPVQPDPFSDEKALLPMSDAMTKTTKVSRKSLGLAFALSAFVLGGSAIGLTAHAQQTRSAQAAPAAPATPVTVDRRAWLYEGTDIPRDEGWQFGTVQQNGLRFAVRRNGVPPGQVSIRLRVDVGSLHERPGEEGWAHLVEHLGFRESRYLTNGEARREWQRLGVAFGSDSNATTAPTETIYQLDIPAATPQSFQESMRLLSGMIREPVLTTATIDAERPIVIAERRERDGVQARLETASRELYFAGQPLADHSPIGTEESLRGANEAGIRAFHQRWYRPERVVIAIAGDLDPRILEQAITSNFGDWRATGAAPQEPDFGRPDPAQPVARVVVEPNQPMIVSMATVRPWQRVTDSVVYTQGLMLDTLASLIINRRLEERARGGGSYLAAQVDLDKPSRSADITNLTVVPLEGNWRGAIEDVRAIVAAARETPPTAAEIAREYATVETYLVREAANAQNEAGTKQVDDLMHAVDIGETTTSPQHALALWQSIRPLATPQRMLEQTRSIFRGDVQRVLMTTPQPIAGVETQLAALVTSAPVRQAANSGQNARAITFADLPRLGRPGRVTSREPIDGLDMERWELSNGVTAIVRQTNIEPGKVRVRVRFGAGRRGVAPTGSNLLWSGDAALVDSGIGRFDQSTLDRLVSGRQIGMSFGVDDDAFEFDAETTPADLRDQLQFLATKLVHPGWQANPVVRARAARLLSFDSLRATPMSVVENELQGIVYAGDTRYVPPTREAIQGLTPQAFRAFWEPQLTRGPVEILIFGDTANINLEQLLAETFGAMPARAPLPVVAAGADIRTMVPPAAPIQIGHRGEATQAAAVLAYPTGGGLESIRTGRQLDVLAEIINDRLFERLRDQSGASYSQAVTSNWPENFRNGGYMFVGGLVRPEDGALLYRLSREIIADIAANSVTPDELQRARTPLIERIIRASSGNVFWMHYVEGGSRNPLVFDALLRFVPDIAQTTPADVQRLAQQYLAPERAIPVLVIPEAQVTAVPATSSATR
jgi:zinc protease